MQSGSSDQLNASLFFTFAMSCDSTENSIEECGGIKKVTCDIGGEVGTLQCQPGND